MTKMPYLQRRANGYYYRQRVPKLLQALIGKTEIVVSLHTLCPREAAYRAAHLSVAVHDYLNTEGNMQHHDLTHEYAAQIAARWKRKALNQDFDHRLSGRPRNLAPGDVELHLQRTLSDLHQVRLEPHAPLIDEVVSEHHLDLDRQSDEWRRLGYYVLKANTELLEEVQKRSDPSQPHPMAYLPPDEDEINTPAALLRLSDAVNRWADDGDKRPKTISEWKSRIRRYVELKGDQDVHRITTKDVRDFKDGYQQLPRRMPESDRRRTLPEIIKRYAHADVARVEAPTVNKALSAISSVLGWCVENGFVEQNVAHGVRAPKPKIKTRRRLPFSNDDLKAIFEGSPVFRDCKRPRGGGGHAAYWIPVIALYTGARLEEIGQLTLDDVRKEDGIDYFDINADDGKSVKTQGSIRRVPIHLKLVELGFFDYLEHVRSRKHKYLFPHIDSSGGFERTRKFSQWVNRYLRRDCGITDTRKVFHSLRHKFKDACRDAAISRDVHDALTGHVDGSVSGRYGEGASLRVLNEGIQSISYTDLAIRYWRLGGLSKTPPSR